MFIVTCTAKTILLQDPPACMPRTPPARAQVLSTAFYSPFLRRCTAPPRAQGSGVWEAAPRTRAAVHDGGPRRAAGAGQGLHGADQVAERARGGWNAVVRPGVVVEVRDGARRGAPQLRGGDQRQVAAAHVCVDVGDGGARHRPAAGPGGRAGLLGEVVRALRARMHAGCC